MCILAVMSFSGFHFPRGYLRGCAVGTRCGVGWVAWAPYSSLLGVLLGRWCACGDGTGVVAVGDCLRMMGGRVGELVLEYLFEVMKLTT